MPILTVGLVCFGFSAINRLMYFKLFLEENISTNMNREEIVNEVTELQASNLHIHQRTGKPITKKPKREPETWICNI